MAAVYVDSTLSENERRNRLYEGDLFVFSPSKSSAALCQLARELSEEAFAPHDPEVAQESMPAERYVEVLADLKPRFIHHPRCKELIAGILQELGCDVEQDVLRRPSPAHDGPRRIPERRPRVPVPCAPRHLVLGPTGTVELVASGLRDRVR